MSIVATIAVSRAHVRDVQLERDPSLGLPADRVAVPPAAIAGADPLDPCIVAVEAEQTLPRWRSRIEPDL